MIANDCAAVREDIDAWALGALDAEETRALEAHLETCAGCRALADAAVNIVDLCTVPDCVGFLVRNRLEDLDVIAQQRKIGKDVDVYRLRACKIEKRLGFLAVFCAQLLGDILHARVQGFNCP